MTGPMLLALAANLLMIVLIVRGRAPFGTSPLLAILLLVLAGVADIKTAFAGFCNPTVVLLASFMAIMAALQKTRFLVKFRALMFKMAAKGGFAAYALLVLVSMLGCSLFGTGATAYYVLTISLLAQLPDSRDLPPSRVLMPAGFGANHPLLPLNTALQYGIVLAVLESGGVMPQVDLVRFSLVNLALSLAFLVWALIAYRLMPDHPLAASAGGAAADAAAAPPQLSAGKQVLTYSCFAAAVVGMVLQSSIGDAGYAVTGLAVAALLIGGALDFREVREALSAPIILMSAGVIGLSGVLRDTGFTALVGRTVAAHMGDNVSPFVLVLVFCLLTGALVSLTGSAIGTVYVFAPLAVSTCVSLGLDPTAAACAVTVAGWCGHLLPTDGMPAMIVSMGGYTMPEYWRFAVPQFFIRHLALAAAAVALFPMR